MANRPKGYGMTAELSSKLAAKYDTEKEQEARCWMEAVVGEPLSDVPQEEELGPARFHEALKDGTYLCKLAMNVTGDKIKVNASKMAFKQMENISNFLSSCEKYGVNKTDMFQTVDLYENQNLWQVVCGIHALGRKAQAQGFAGPSLGPKESSKNTREFSEDQLKAGQNVIGLQMGTNKGASQAGMTFGGVRHIADIKVDEASRESQGVIGLQMGSNKGANASGVSYGKPRDIMGVDKPEADKPEADKPEADKPEADK